MRQNNDFFSANLIKNGSTSLTAREWLTHWNNYSFCERQDRKLLLDRLVNVTQVPAETMSQFFNWSTLGEHQRADEDWFNYFNPVLLNDFKNRASRLLHRELSDDAWFKLFTKFCERKTKRVTYLFLIENLRHLYKTNWEEMVTILSDVQPKRGTQEEISPEIPPRKRKRSFMLPDLERNPLIVDVDHTPQPYLNSILETGAKAETITQSPSGKKYISGKKEVRLVYQNSITNLFLLNTPVKASVRSRQDILKQEPKLIWQQATPCRFTATREKILQNQNKKRRMGQNYFFKTSCKSVFLAHDPEIRSQQKTGHYFHWSHIIALFLGGFHQVDKLFAATASANYAMLFLVEKYIEKKLFENRRYPIEKIEMEVIPKYNQETMIPFDVEIELRWEETDDNGFSQQMFEMHHIKPSSYMIFDLSMDRTIQKVRELNKEHLVKTQHSQELNNEDSQPANLPTILA